MSQKLKVVHLREDGEWGTFFVRYSEGERPFLELTCNTSFGVVGYYWSAPGDNALKFLTQIDSDYTINKLWQKSLVFDWTATYQALTDCIAKELQDDEISKGDAEWWLESLHCGHAQDENEWYLFCGEVGSDFSERYITEWKKITNPQAQGFWDKLWKPFLERLKDTPACELPSS